MKYFTPGLILMISLLFFSSCTSHDATLSKQDSLAKPPDQSLAGKLYFFAPEYDSTLFVTTGACDCCSANTIFLDDSNFLYIDYCDEGDSYSKGTYHLRNNELEMNFDSLSVEKLYPGDQGKNSMADLSPKFTYHATINKLDKRNYKKQDYKGHVVLKGMHEFGAVDIHGTADSTMKEAQAEGIWDRLTGKTKVVNPHAPAAAMPDILGIWAGPEDINASFEIQESVIYYLDGSKEYSYELKQDSMRIKYDDYVGAFAIKMIGTDTLVFEGRDRKVFHRFKN